MNSTKRFVACIFYNENNIFFSNLMNFFYKNDSKVKLSINHITYQNFKSVLRPLIMIILDV